MKEKNFFKTYEITIDGDFTSEDNFINLAGGHHLFPIATVATEGEAIAAINAYITGLTRIADVWFYNPLIFFAFFFLL